MTRFVGVDLAWGQRHRSGVAELAPDGSLLEFGDRTTDDELLAWLRPRCQGAVVVAFDAPLVVTNATGSRPAEQTVGHLFRRQHAGCHPTNLGRPDFADGGRAARLARQLGLATDPRDAGGRTALEVYPHAALVALFELELILRYKDRPGRDLAFRRVEMLRLMDGLESLAAAPVPLRVAADPRWRQVRAAVTDAPTKAALSRVEDSIDAVVCAYVALHAHRRPDRTALFGTLADGYIVSPVTAAMAARLPAVDAAGHPAALWFEGETGSMTDPLTPAAVDQALTDLTEWRGADGVLLAAYAADTVADALALVAAIGAVAEELNHHPDVDWRYDRVFVGTTSHDVGGRLTARDLALAERITALAGTAAVTAIPDEARPGS